MESPDERALKIAANSIARAGAIADCAEDAVDEHEFIHEALGFPSRLSLIRPSGTFSRKDKEKLACPFNVELDVSLPGIDPAVAQDLVDAANRDICPYSHATRGNVDVKSALV